MGGQRLAIGGLVLVPLGAGLAVARDVDYPYLAIGLGVALVLVVLLTLAPTLPVLHRLPLFGAARPINVRLLLNGAEELTVRIRDGEPRTALLEVGITNSQRDDLTSPIVSILIPEHLEGRRVDAEGNAVDLGKWMPATDELRADDGRTIHSPYWVYDRTLQGRTSHLAHFKLTCGKPGRYPIRIKIVAPGLRDEFIADAKVSVIPAKPSNELVADLVTDLIDQGEANASKLRANALDDSAARIAYMDWRFQAERDLPPVLFRRFEAPPLNHDGPQVGAAYMLSLYQRELKRLYRLRADPDAQGPVSAPPPN